MAGQAGRPAGSDPVATVVLARLALLALVVAIGLFLVLSLKNITLPGLYYDEALDVVPAMQLLHGAPVEPVRGAGVSRGGRVFPLMVMDYVGTVNTYLAIPLFAVAGVSVTSVRLLPIIIAVVCLALGFRLAQRLFDWRVAALATLLCAVDPSFVFFSRMGIHVTSVMNVFALGSVLALLRWRDEQRTRWLALAGLLLGLGLWAKVLFLWWIIALAVFAAMLLLRNARPRRAAMLAASSNARPRRAAMLAASSNARPRRAAMLAASSNARPRRAAMLASRRDGATLAAGVFIGAAPLWLYNLTTGGTLIAFGRNALVTEHGVNNLNIVANLWAALGSFAVLLDGRYFWFLGKQLANSANIVIFTVSALACALLERRQPAWRMGLALVGAVMAVIVALSAFTVSGIWATHLYILFPLPQMVMAAGIILTAEALAGKRPTLGAVLAALLAVGVMAANVRLDLAYHSELARSHGLSRFSDAIYDLAAWLEARAPLSVYAVDWGIQKNVQILTQGRVNPIEISGFAGEPAQDFVRRAEEALRTPGAVYVMHSREDTVFELYPLFQATADRLGVRLRIVDATHDQSGAPVHVIWARE